MCFYGWGLGPPIVHVPFSCVSMDGGLGPPIVLVPPPHAYAYTHTQTPIVTVFIYILCSFGVCIGTGLILTGRTNFSPERVTACRVLILAIARIRQWQQAHLQSSMHP